MLETFEPLLAAAENVIIEARTLARFEPVIFDADVVDLVHATRPTNEEAPDFVKEWVSWGAGTRASQNLLLGAKARALLQGRYHVAIEDIEVLRAQKNYVQLVTRSGDCYRCRGPLARLVERLDPRAFLPLNRSEVVRLDAVAELQPWFRGDYRVVLRDGETLVWSRRYRARYKDRFRPG